VRAGRLHRVHHGVYALGHTLLRPEGHRLAAVPACGPDAVLSHRSAAAHWELLATSQERIDVTAARSRQGVPGIRLHTSRCLDAKDTTRHEGIPFTLHAPDHGECKPDFYWPACGVIVETDGWEAHRTLAAFRSDRAKDAALTAAGYEVLRFTWDVDDAAILRRLRPLLQN
jgi:hypothetical protein